MEDLEIKYRRKYIQKGIFYISECERFVYYHDYNWRWDKHYYKSGGKSGLESSLHRQVWKDVNGDIPKGHHIHHIDGNTKNNDITNLQCLSSFYHLSQTAKQSKWVGSEGNKKQLENVQELAKEWHSSNEGIKWHSEHGKVSWKNRKIFDKLCLICKKKFKTPFPLRAKFCSNNCKSQYRRNIKKDYIKSNCIICSQQFEHNRYNPTKTCSSNCATISMKRTRYGSIKSDFDAIRKYYGG